MADGEALEVRVARLEEQVEAGREAIASAAGQRASLADEISLIRVTLGTLSNELTHVQTSCAAMQSSLTWLVRLVFGLIITALLGAVVGGALFRL